MTASGILYRGLAVRIDGLQIKTPADDPRLSLRMSPPADATKRRARVKQIIVHTTKGLPRKRLLAHHSSAVDHAARIARYWSTSPKHSGAHLIIDADTQVACTADVADVAAYHAGPVNQTSIGIEVYEGSCPDDVGVLYEDQLDALVVLVEWLTARFGVQRQIHWPYSGPIDRLEDGGRDCYGVFGHRDVTGRRGAGDPGDLIMNRLRLAGYETFDFSSGDDREAWTHRQQHLNRRGASLAVDGLPGPATTAALRAAGYKHGLWVLGNGSTPADTRRLDSAVKHLLGEWGRAAVLESLQRQP